MIFGLFNLENAIKPYIENVSGLCLNGEASDLINLTIIRQLFC